ncbi:MAG TPA: cytochrome c maturation protein CcmE [Spirochaetota bacterium]|nr:cytochrome c maturation protein CcmE [Spirochaetota bacterium]HPI89537.1 cytochrome c maturation protein CcmE [Spirochaetota bacterium]HPR49001.1 cytochrome c maturation protein CcmE [Spirochaetota bacterium]
MKNRNIILFSIVLILMVVAVLSLSNNIMSPYVSFEYAVRNQGSYVQIIGMRDKSKPVEYKDGSFSFTIKGEEGDSMVVSHNGAVPLNFDHADRIVLLGKYDRGSGAFLADKVLVKCPSKYSKEQ